MANKDKANKEHGGFPRKTERATCAVKTDLDSFSETWNAVGHLLTSIPDDDINWAKSHVKSQEDT